jgi:FKBP-type peptidyl-prolyl cis-trans isomerase FkpA
MRSMIRNAVIGLVVAVAAAGCSKDSGTSPSSTVNVPFSNTDLRVGTGTEATAGRTVTVNYTGWLYNTQGVDNKGVQFDTSVGRTPLVFVLGTSQIIPGFNQGVTGMKVGGLRRTVMPPNVAYGSQGSGSTIPPNATLIFDIELLAVQ